MILDSPTTWFLVGWLFLIAFIVRWFHVLSAGSDLDEERTPIDHGRDEPDGLRAVS